MSSTTTTRSYAGVSQRHKPCQCGQAHTAGCKRRDDESAAERCRCPRAHTARCPHRVRPDGKTACGCPWSFVSEVVRAGKREQTTGSGFTSKTAAAKARAEALEVLQKTPSAAKRGGMLAELVADWMQHRSEGSRALRPSTAHDYERYRTYIAEAIGGTRLRDVDARTLDAFGRWMRKHHAGADTAHVRAFAVLQAAIRWGYRRGMLPSDPTATYDAKPTTTRKRRTVMQPADFMRFYAWAVARGERLAPVVWFDVNTGLRRGEVCALSWLTVDLERGVLIVDDNAVQVGKTVHVGRVKTVNGEGRPVDLDASTVALLREVREQQQRDAAAWGDAYTEHGLVFTREDGTPWKPEQLTKGLPRLIRQYNREAAIYALDAVEDAVELEQLGKHKGMGAAKLARIRIDVTLEGGPLPVVSPHSLRHLAGSLRLAVANGDLLSVSRFLGHGSIALTADVYGHEIRELQQRQAAGVAAVLREAGRTAAEPIPEHG